MSLQKQGLLSKNPKSAGLSKEIHLVSVHRGNDGESLSNTNMVIL